MGDPFDRDIGIIVIEFGADPFFGVEDSDGDDGTVYGLYYFDRVKIFWRDTLFMWRCHCSVYVGAASLF
jgi:hypothetical protein